jgi:hypothetical protein
MTWLGYLVHRKFDPLDRQLCVWYNFIAAVVTHCTRCCRGRTAMQYAKSYDIVPITAVALWLNNEEGEPCKNGAIAYFTSNKIYGYPFVAFCDAFFTATPSLDDAIKNADANQDLQQNSLNLEARATVLIYELPHINWGTAKECRGLNDGEGCNDLWQL